MANSPVVTGEPAAERSGPAPRRGGESLRSAARSAAVEFREQAAALWSVRILIGVALTKLAFLALPTGASLPRRAGFIVDTLTDPTGKRHGILDGLVRWDALHYIHIAQFGYPAASPGASSSAFAAFFPLYPFLVRIVATLVPVGGADRYRYAAVGVSWVCLLAAVWGILLIAREWSPRGNPRDAALAFAWFPASVFLLSGYSESLFAALLAWALYAFARKRYVAVAVLAGLSAATHSQGALLVLLVAWPTVKRQLPVVKGLLLCVVSEAGLLAYGMFCWVRYGSPLAFVDAEKFWNRKLTYPLHPVLWFVRSAIDGHAGPGSQSAVLALDSIAGVVAVIGCVALLVAARRGHIPVPVALLASALVLLDISSGPSGKSPEAMARFVMTVVPLYVLVPGLVRRFPSGRSWLMASAMLAALFQVLFTLGFWFT